MPKHISQAEVRTVWSSSFVENILFLLFVNCILVLLHHQTSICRQMVLHSPAKFHNNHGISFFLSTIASCPGPCGSRAAPNQDGPPSYFTAGMRCQCALHFFSMHSNVCSFQKTQLWFYHYQNILPV